ncbi:MAG: SigE family RNA polymerase sigma factor [Actinomycetota bacterium]|nr:SigE family RNA polymerase sigma factor [Actinomycetota bacterium]
MPGDDRADSVWSDGVQALYRERFDQMVRLASLMTGSVAVGEEIVQDAFIRCRHVLPGAEQPAAYLRAAVVNGCRSFHRRRNLALGLWPRTGALPESVDPELHELADILAMLPPRQRTVLVLRYYADLSEAEIAEAMDCRPGTVKSLAHRGLARMRALIEP